MDVFSLSTVWSIWRGFLPSFLRWGMRHDALKNYSKPPPQKKTINNHQSNYKPTTSKIIKNPLNNRTQKPNNIFFWHQQIPKKAHQKNKSLGKKHPKKQIPREKHPKKTKTKPPVPPSHFSFFNATVELTGDFQQRTSRGGRDVRRLQMASAAEPVTLWVRRGERKVVGKWLVFFFSVSFCLNIDHFFHVLDVFLISCLRFLFVLIVLSFNGKPHAQRWHIEQQKQLVLKLP